MRSADVEDRVVHPGTFNGHALSAAMGERCLRMIAESVWNWRADEVGKNLWERLDAIVNRWGGNAFCGRRGSLVWLVPGSKWNDEWGERGRMDLGPRDVLEKARKGSGEGVMRWMRKAFLVEGVDTLDGCLFVCSAPHRTTYRSPSSDESPEPPSAHAPRQYRSPRRTS